MQKKRREKKRKRKEEKRERKREGKKERMRKRESCLFVILLLFLLQFYVFLLLLLKKEKKRKIQKEKEKRKKRRKKEKKSFLVLFFRSLSNSACRLGLNIIKADLKQEEQELENDREKPEKISITSIPSLSHSTKESSGESGGPRSDCSWAALHDTTHGINTLERRCPMI